MSPDSRDVPVGPLIAAVGAVLLIVSLFLNWYEGVTGFTVFEFIDLLLVVMALLTVASLAGGMGLVRPAVSPPISLAVTLFTLFVVVSQVINDPPAVARTGPDQDIGIWLALAGAALMVAGALLATTRISLAVESRPGPGGGRAAPERDPDATEPLSEPGPAPGGRERL